MNLYDIDRELLNLSLELTELLQSGEVPAEFAEKLELMSLLKDEKLINIGKLIKNLDYLNECLRVERQLLTEKTRRNERQIEWLKEYVASSIGEGTKLDYGVVKYSWRASEQLIIPDEGEVPMVYCRVKYEPNKKQITEDIKAGASIPFARLEKRNNLQVK